MRYLRGQRPAGAEMRMVRHWLGMIGGLIVVLSLTARRRGRPGSALPVLLTGLTGTAFGLGGMIAVKPDPTFAIFLVPGLLVLAGSSNSVTERAGAI
jgi:hypothetical protein